MSAKKYLIGSAVALCIYATGCGSDVKILHSIDECVKTVESTPLSEQKLSPDYRMRCAASLNGEYSDELWKNIPEDKRRTIIESYFNQLTVDEKADVVKKCLGDKASGVYGSIRSGISKAYGQLLDDVGDSTAPPFTLNVKEITTVDHQTLQVSYDQIKRFLKR